MATFQETYCADERCPESRFVERVLWRCLHRRAQLLRPLLVLMQPDYFAPDRELVEHVGRASRIAQVEEEIRDYMSDHRNVEWVRGRARLRISTRRLRSLARGYLERTETKRVHDAPK